jgi:large subunit ribosomal protein L32
LAPLPKKKTPNSAKGKRRSHLHMRSTGLSECPRCHSARLPHRVCPSCGFYRGRDAITIGKPELPAE